MRELIAYIISGLLILIALFLLRKSKPIVSEDRLIFRTPLHFKIAIILCFLFYLGLTVAAFIDGADIFTVSFFMIFTLIMSSALPLLIRRLIITKNIIDYRNSFGNWKRFDLNDLEKVDYLSNIGGLELCFTSGKAKFYYGFGGSVYFLLYLESRFPDKLTQKAKEYISHQLAIHYVPLI